MAEELRLTLKLIHILAATALLGGLGAQAVWKILADRSRDAREVAAVLETMIRVDRAITGPAALVVFASGYPVIRMMGYYGGSIGGAPFALWGLILLTVAVVVWWFALRPLDMRMADAAQDAARGGRNLGADYARLSGLWFLAWAVVVGVLLVVAWLMVFKPGQA